MTEQERFNFPPLGPTGEGDPPYPDRRGELLWASPDGRFSVAHQGDRPAVAFRCYQRLGRSGAMSHPCDERTALRFIFWAKKQP